MSTQSAKPSFLFGSPKTLIILLVLLLVPFVSKALLWLPLSPERVDFGADFAALMVPWTQTSVSAWQNGEIPLWTPYEGIGRPLISNIQSAVFYPGTWVLALVTGEKTPIRLLEAYLLLHLSIAAFGVYWLGRTCGLRRLPAAFAAFVFTTCGFYLHHIANLALVLSAAWVPYVVAAAIKAMDNNGWKWVPACALFVALSLISGLPQPAYYAVLFVILASIYFAIVLRSYIPLLKLCVAGALSFAFAAHTLLPGLRELPLLFRAGSGWKAGIFDTSSFFGRIAAFFAPEAGAALNVTLPYNLFFGTIPLLLVVLALRNSDLQRKVLLVIAFCFFAIIGISEDVSLDSVLNPALPGYSFYMNHARAGLLVALFGSLLAAAGIQALGDKKTIKGQATTWGVGALILAIVLAASVFSQLPAQRWENSVYVALTVLSACAFFALPLLRRKHSKAAIVVLMVLAAPQMLFLSNTNNLRTGIHERVELFDQQTAAIPKGDFPARIRRQQYWDWNALDAYFGLNGFMSGDSNQYLDLKELWRAADTHHQLNDLFNVEYRQFTEQPKGTQPRAPAAFRLDDKNRLQRYDLAHAGTARRLRIRIAIQPAETGEAQVEAAVRTQDGSATAVQLSTIDPPEGARADLVHYAGSATFGRERVNLAALWVRLVEGLEARVHQISIDGGPTVKLPARMQPIWRDIYRGTDAMPRAFLVTDYIACEDKAEMAYRLGEEFEFDTHVLLLADDAPTAMDPQSFSALEAAQSVARISAYGRHKVSINVESPRPALLVLSDFFHPGWRAEVDGEEREILRANFCARAVLVPAGSSTVTFSYSDPLAIAGIVISLLALIGSGIAIYWNPIREKLSRSAR